MDTCAHGTLQALHNESTRHKEGTKRRGHMQTGFKVCHGVTVWEMGAGGNVEDLGGNCKGLREKPRIRHM